MVTWTLDSPMRLFSAVKKRVGEAYTSTDIRWCIEHNRCYVNRQVERFVSTHVERGDRITCIITHAPSPYLVTRERVLYEDEHLLAYDKPAGLVSEELASRSGYQLVHRLDRDTTGIILLAKDRESQRHLEEQFRRRTITKDYLALVRGKTSKQGEIGGYLSPLHKKDGRSLWRLSSQGLWSHTTWRSLRSTPSYSLLHCIPETGRTHQIRVHLSHIGHPIVGDFIYGPAAYTPHIFSHLLHAYRLSFIHPLSHTRVSLSSPPPRELTHSPLLEGAKPLPYNAPSPLSLDCTVVKEENYAPDRSKR